MTRFSRMALLAAFLALHIALPRAGAPARRLIHLTAHQQDSDDSHSRPHRQHQQLSRHHRDQPGWPLRRAAEQRLWNAGDLGHAVDRDSRPEDESTLRLSRQAFRRRRASELFPRPGLRLRWQAPLRIGRFHHRSDRREAGKHRQRHRCLLLLQMARSRPNDSSLSNRKRSPPGRKSQSLCAQRRRAPRFLIPQDWRWFQPVQAATASSSPTIFPTTQCCSMLRAAKCSRVST